MNNNDNPSVDRPSPDRRDTPSSFPAEATSPSSRTTHAIPPPLRRSRSELRTADEYDAAASTYDDRWAEYTKKTINATLDVLERRLRRVGDAVERVDARDEESTPGEAKERGVCSEMRVLDVGCGTGELFRWMQRRGMVDEDSHLVGIDVSADMLRVARGKAPDRIGRGCTHTGDRDGDHAGGGGGGGDGDSRGSDDGVDQGSGGVGGGSGNRDGRGDAHADNMGSVGVDVDIEYHLRGAGDSLDDLGSFDLVVSANSFHFWPDPLLALREIHNALQPGGALLISDWSHDFVMCKVLSFYLKWIKGEEHGSTIYTTRQVREWMASAGFTDVITESYSIGWWGMMAVSGRKV
eukprot:TRINITY_DN4043_c0_g1_i1.p1 TRINITY_DN4043_c0_g1~~TRINITY_DN4043_c0_g1_i1.p1  ORF type:complete len:351 (-),score=88.90 TRINITY_DN4043_c0_g1_i1:58-1110(-)